jgi:hypothetical protein
VALLVFLSGALEPLVDQRTPAVVIFGLSTTRSGRVCRSTVHWSFLASRSLGAFHHLAFSCIFQGEVIQGRRADARHRAHHGIIFRKRKDAIREFVFLKRSRHGGDHTQVWLWKIIPQWCGGEGVAQSRRSESQSEFLPTRTSTAKGFQRCSL